MPQVEIETTLFLSQFQASPRFGLAPLEVTFNDSVSGDIIVETVDSENIIIEDEESDYILIETIF